MVAPSSEANQIHHASGQSGASPLGRAGDLAEQRPCGERLGNRQLGSRQLGSRQLGNEQLCGECNCDERSLAELARGARCRVARVLGDASDVSRLGAMGVCQGRVLEVLRSGDAWIVRVLGSRVGISERLAAAVLVTAA